MSNWLLVANLVFLAVLTVVVLQIKQGYNSLSDRKAIEDVWAQYTYHWDSKNSLGFADLFTQDTVVEHWMLGEVRSRLEGRSALLAYAKDSHEGRIEKSTMDTLATYSG